MSLMREPEEKVIDGITYKCQVHTGEKLLWFFSRLVLIFTEPVAHLIMAVIVGEEKGGSSFQNILDSDFDLTQISTALARLADKLTPDEYVEFVKSFLSGTFEKNQSVTKDFSTRFMGNMLHLHKVLAFAMEVNFADFFTAFQNAKSQQRKREPLS
jgi:hypothetical protein